MAPFEKPMAIGALVTLWLLRAGSDVGLVNGPIVEAVHLSK